MYEKFGWSAAAPERPAPAGPSTTRADKLKAKQDLDPVQGRSIAASIEPRKPEQSFRLDTA